MKLKLYQFKFEILFLVFFVGIESTGYAQNNSHFESPVTWGSRPHYDYEKVKEGFNQPSLIYAPFTFWFWDDSVDVDLAANMAEEMSKKGLNPGYVHPRSGLPRDQWLTSQWFEAVNAALLKAEENGTYLGYVDEYNWPTGRANGKVLEQHPELKGSSLSWEIIDFKEGETKSLPPSFFTVAARRLNDENKPDTLTTISSETLKIIGEGESFDWTATDGNWRVFSFNKYHKDYITSKVNYLDRSLAPAFIKIAQDPYEKHFAEKMGSTIPGHFNDNEGDYGWKLAWSDDLASQYMARTGMDLRVWMPLMITQDLEGKWPVIRWNWYNTASDLYHDGFFGVINSWLEERGMYNISNLWEETLLTQQMHVGDFFKAQRSVSMPGNDALGAKALSSQDFKETQSVSEFENRRFQSEILGVAGWQMTPVLMKKTINSIITWGVSHVVPHGINLNRELNTIPYPADWFTSNPYWRYFDLWTDFTRRASYINSQGNTDPDVLLFNPMDTYWGLVGGDIMKPQADTSAALTGHGEILEHVEDVYSQAIDDLTAANIEYLISDRYYLRQIDLTTNGRLVRESFEFKAMVLPPMVILPLDIAQKIVRFAESGGVVYFLGQLPSGSAENGWDDPQMIKLMEKLKEIPSVKEVENGIHELVEAEAPFMKPKMMFDSNRFDILTLHRRIDGKDFFWLANNTGETQQSLLTFRNTKGQGSIWDPETGLIEEIPSKQVGEGSKVNLTFKDYQAYWLVFDPSTEVTEEGISNEPNWEILTSLEDHQWNVKIDTTAQPVPVGPELLAPQTLIEGARHSLAPWQEWGLEQFSGYVDYSTSVEVDQIPQTVKLDLGEVKHMAEVWINDKRVGARLWPPFEFDIQKYLNPGKNQITIRVGNLLSNAMSQYEDNTRFDFDWLGEFQVPNDLSAGLIGPVILRKPSLNN